MLPAALLPLIAGSAPTAAGVAQGGLLDSAFQGTFGGLINQLPGAMAMDEGESPWRLPEQAQAPQGNSAPDMTGFMDEAAQRATGTRSAMEQQIERNKMMMATRRRKQVMDQLMQQNKALRQQGSRSPLNMY